jgi:ribosomal protein L34E
VSSLFCRHNRLTAKCPICSRELEAELRAKAPARPARARTTTSSRSSTAKRAARPSGGVVTKRLYRAADDGYSNPLVPGLRGTADAERLALAIGAAAQRLEPPGPYASVATEPDLEEATWLAFLLALVGPEAPELQAAVEAARPSWAAGEQPGLPEAQQRTAAAYRAWAARAGTQRAAFTGESGWTPERRFARVFERLALPGFGRAPRFDLLATLGAAGHYDVSAGELELGVEDDAATLAAKRVLLSGDKMLLERRARELAAACDVPLAALDRGFAVFGTPGADPGTVAVDAVRAALKL